MIRTLLIAAVAVGAVAGPVHAQPSELAVRISSADLDSREGRARIRRQVAGAIEQLCGSYASVEAYQWDQVDDCRRQAWESSTRQIANLRDKKPVKVGAR